MTGAERPWLIRVRSTLEIASAVALIVTCLLVAWRLRGAPTEETIDGTTKTVPGNTLQDVDERLGAEHLGNSMGKARVVLVEFIDFQCPYCARFAARTFPDVKQTLVDKNIAQYVALNYPLDLIHPLATRASEAAECAGKQGRYWEMHDRLFASKGEFEDGSLVRYAADLGMDEDVFESCLNGETREKIRSDVAQGTRLRIRGTPAIFIGERQRDGSVRLLKRADGAVPFDILEKEIRSLHSKLMATKAS